MTNEEIRNLCFSLLKIDSEEELIEVLKSHGLWDNPDFWRYYSDKEDNFSTIGNQQSRPEAAFVEKLVNSVDAVLMRFCWLSGISPEDEKAPKSIYEAVALYFGGDIKKYETLGHVGYWSTKQRTEVSKLITVTSTGDRSNPCFTISDAGEGQTPNKMPTTLLDLNHKNKLGVHFVQGKFNMGSTGVFQFCGKHNLQLIISRRNPKILNTQASEPSDFQWGFTIVRREDPTPGRKSSVYTYLAPLNTEQKPRFGDILRFSSDTFPIFPDGRNPYSREAEWGTAIKLYEYNAAGFSTNMMLRDGLLSRLDILLPEIALPIRLYECRDYKGHKGSFETTLSGLTVRLEDNKADNLEEGFPTTSPFVVNNERMAAKIYAFKKGRAETYRKNEGIIFTVNGQTHAYLPLSFFSRKSVGMGRLDDSVIVVIDCSNLSGRAREDLFMNSRDRLRHGELRDEIERELEDLIKDHPGLRALKERRRDEDIKSKISDSKPLEEALKTILKSSPSLSSLFLTGTRLSNPFKSTSVEGMDKPYPGKPHPTYIKFQKLDYGQILERTTPANMRSRITFETDVVNDYFYRLEYKGIFSLKTIVNGNVKEVYSYSLNLQNGKATLSLKLPLGGLVGDIIEYEAMVTDDTLALPFVNRFRVTIGHPQEAKPTYSIKDAKPPSDKIGNQRDVPRGLQIPEINEVYQQDWDKRKHKFDQFSALEIVQEEAADNEGQAAESSAIYSFYVNMDNIYLKTEMKYSKANLDLLKARYQYGLVLIGMALIQGDSQSDKLKEKYVSSEGSNNGENITIEETVYQTTSSIAPVLLPLIESLGNLTEEEIMVGSQTGDDE